MGHEVAHNSGHTNAFLGITIINNAILMATMIVTVTMVTMIITIMIIATRVTMIIVTGGSGDGKSFRMFCRRHGCQ